MSESSTSLTGESHSDATGADAPVGNALRETQVEQGQALDRGFAEMRARLDQTTGGLDQILGLLNTLIARDDKA